MYFIDLNLTYYYKISKFDTNNKNMKYHPIPSQLFIKNRVKLSQQMKPNSIAVFNSNDVFSTGADSTLPFEQHRNIFYLSGVDQEESILIVFPIGFQKGHIVFFIMKHVI